LQTPVIASEPSDERRAPTDDREPPDGDTSAGATGDPAGRIGALRGAGVDVDRRLLGRIVVVLALTALAASSALLFAVGAHQNDQIDRLHREGIPVVARVTGCLGLLGGSGSNAAGYSCNGTYVIGGHRYVEAIPGDVLRRPGATVAVIVANDDPTLLALPRTLAREHASWPVFILPFVLLLLFVMALIVVVRRWRRGRTQR
jgi:hypothetical protein